MIKTRKQTLCYNVQANGLFTHRRHIQEQLNKNIAKQNFNNDKSNGIQENSERTRWIKDGYSHKISLKAM